MSYILVENPSISLGMEFCEEGFKWFDEALGELHREFCQKATEAGKKETFTIKIKGLFGSYLLDVVYENSIFELRGLTRAGELNERKSN